MAPSPAQIEDLQCRLDAEAALSTTAEALAEGSEARVEALPVDKALCSHTGSRKNANCAPQVRLGRRVPAKIFACVQN